jgi:hypothetical protein
LADVEGDEALKGVKSGRNVQQIEVSRAKPEVPREDWGSFGKEQLLR